MSVLITDDPQGNPTRKSHKKGRNNEYLLQRNECLINRYYYYKNFSDKRYDAIVQLLSAEFFLSKRTITDLVLEHRTLLLELKKKRPTISYFNNRWTYLKW